MKSKRDMTSIFITFTALLTFASTTWGSNYCDNYLSSSFKRHLSQHMSQNQCDSESNLCIRDKSTTNYIEDCLVKKGDKEKKRLAELRDRSIIYYRDVLHKGTKGEFTIESMQLLNLTRDYPKAHCKDHSGSLRCTWQEPNGQVASHHFQTLNEKVVAEFVPQNVDDPSTESANNDSDTEANDQTTQNATNENSDEQNLTPLQKYMFGVINQKHSKQGKRHLSLPEREPSSEETASTTSTQ